MRYSEITEAPVGNLEVHNMGQSGTFPDVDRRLLTNPEHIKKIRQRFEKVPFDFDLYFVNQDKSYMQSLGSAPDEAVWNNQTHIFTNAWHDDLNDYAGEATPEDVKLKFGLTIVPKPETISVIYLSNANETNSIPMTPWIVAHRFAHALTDPVKGRVSPDLYHALHALPEPHRQIGPDLPISVMKLMTNRSARNNIGIEYTEELIAQYIIMGGVKLALPADFETSIWAIGNPDLARKAPQRVQQYANSLSVKIDKIMDQCVGKIFISV